MKLLFNLSHEWWNSCSNSVCKETKNQHSQEGKYWIHNSVKKRFFNHTNFTRIKKDFSSRRSWMSRWKKYWKQKSSWCLEWLVHCIYLGLLHNEQHEQTLEQTFSLLGFRVQRLEENINFIFIQEAFLQSSSRIIISNLKS